MCEQTKSKIYCIYWSVWKRSFLEYFKQPFCDKSSKDGCPVYLLSFKWEKQVFIFSHRRNCDKILRKQNLQLHYCFLCTLPWERPVDISWVDVDSLLASVAVVKETPKDDDWMASDLENHINEFVQTNKKIFVQFEAKLEISASNSQTVVSIVSTSKSIVDVLIKNRINTFAEVKQNASSGMVFRIMQ